MSIKHRDAPPYFAELDAEYEILREIGRSGTDVVYLARERELDREVAIKVVRVPFTWLPTKRHPDYSAREARALAALRHPNLITLFDTQPLSHGRLALITQHIYGVTLKADLEQLGALQFTEVERILAEIGDALAYVQSIGLVHRDVKTGNIYLDEATGRAFLGVARLWDDGAAVGSRDTAPEADAGRDPRHDVFALGLVAYEMLGGHVPATGESRFSRIYKPRHQDLPALNALRPDIPPRLQYVVERALRGNPVERWANAGDLVDALTDRTATNTPQAESAPTWRSAVLSAAPAAPAPPVAQSAPPPSPALRSSERHDKPPLVAVAAPVPTEPDKRPVVAVAAPPPTEPDKRPVVAVAAPVSTKGVRPGLFGDSWKAAVAYALILVLVVVPTLIVRGRGNNQRTASAQVTEPPAAPNEPAVPFADVPVQEKAAADAFPALMVPLVGGEQVGVAGDTLPTPLVVQIKDAADRTIADAPVAFRVTGGRGRIEPATALSDEHGIVRVRWLPLEAGRHEVEAFIPGSDVVIPVTFRARISARPKAETVAAAPEPVEEKSVARPPEVPRLTVRPVVTVGGTHSCSLQSAGEVWCWGGNESGQAGAGSVSRRLSSGRVAVPEPVAELSAGVSHTCALSVFGRAYCWGANDAGQLGDGTTASRAEPVRVAGDGVFTRIFAGAGHTCALDASGGLYCWGRNTNGQVGDGTRTNRAVPVRTGGSRSFASVAVGWAHTCALSDGRAYCWGRNTSGELGDGRTSDRSSPAAVTGAYNFTALAAGSTHTCGLTGGGTVLCWGQNTHGQLGTGDRSSSAVPLQVAAAEPFSQLTVGSVHTCGLTRRGEALCWGANNYGQLGDGSTEDRARPAPVDGGYRFGSLHAKGAHTCGTAPGGGGTSYCWGFNLSGQLGDGTRSNRTRPVVAGSPR